MGACSRRFTAAPAFATRRLVRIFAVSPVCGSVPRRPAAGPCVIVVDVSVVVHFSTAMSAAEAQPLVHAGVKRREILIEMV